MLIMPYKRHDTRPKEFNSIKACCIGLDCLFVHNNPPNFDRIWTNSHSILSSKLLFVNHFLTHSALYNCFFNQAPLQFSQTVRFSGTRPGWSYRSRLSYTKESQCATLGVVKKDAGIPGGVIVHALLLVSLR